MKTSITELFGIKYPILNAGMGWVALPNMVAAVSNAGGLGVFGAGSQPPELTRERIREIRTLTDKPFGVNCPLAMPNGMANAEVALQEKVAIINYSMGNGEWIVKRAHQYGAKVMASVPAIRFALRAQAHGADAVIAAGHEAAGHAGAVTTFVLVPRLVELLKIPVIAAGGIANGIGLAAALTLGAGGVSMGTRFWTTKEGPMHQNFKNKAVELDVGDTIYSDRFDGIPNRMMKTEGSVRLEAERLNPWDVFMRSFGIAKEFNMPYMKLVLGILSKGPTTAMNMMRMSRMIKMNKIIFTTGDLKTGATASGMSVGLVHDIPTVAELIERIVAEAEAAHRNFSAKMAG